MCRRTQQITHKCLELLAVRIIQEIAVNTGKILHQDINCREVALLLHSLDQRKIVAHAVLAGADRSPAISQQRNALLRREFSLGNLAQSAQHRGIVDRPVVAHGIGIGEYPWRAATQFDGLLLFGNKLAAPAFLGLYANWDLPKFTRGLLQQLAVVVKTLLRECDFGPAVSAGGLHREQRRARLGNEGGHDLIHWFV